MWLFWPNLGQVTRFGTRDESPSLMEDMHNIDCIDQPNVWDWDTWNQKHWWLVQPMNTMTFYGFYTISFFNASQNQFNQNKHFVVRKLFLFKNTLKYNFVWAILSSFGHFNRYIICSLKKVILRTLQNFEHSDEFAKMTHFEWTYGMSIIKPFTEQ